MSFLYAATVSTKQGKAKIDHQGNFYIPGRMTVVEAKDVTDVAIEDGEAASSRITATRVLAIGVLALAARKRTGGTKFLVIETEEDVYALEVDRKNHGDAVRFKAAARKFIR